MTSIPFPGEPSLYLTEGMRLETIRTQQLTMLPEEVKRGHGELYACVDFNALRGANELQSLHGPKKCGPGESARGQGMVFENACILAEPSRQVQTGCCSKPYTEQLTPKRNGPEGGKPPGLWRDQSGKPTLA